MLCGILLIMPIHIQAKKESSNMKSEKEFEIPPTEDLMREHGILNRVLLIYEEIIKRLENNDFQIDALRKAVEIIKSFIEEYHEMLEENYIFPLFEKQNKEIRLVKTLRNQHTKGREVTARIQELIASSTIKDAAAQREIKSLLKKFITMYRPHEAREDTELFPKVRSLISEHEFKELGEKFEEIEHKLFKGGFETMVKKVENIEKELGIYQLEQFTPKINSK